MARLGPPFSPLNPPRKKLCGSLFCVLSEEMRHVNFFLGAQNEVFWVGAKKFMSVSRRGGRNKGGRKQMRANANKRRQTLTNARKRGGENASKRKQTQANVDKRKQTLTPPFIAVFYTPLCDPLNFTPGPLSTIFGCFPAVSRSSVCGLCSWAGRSQPRGVQKNFGLIFCCTTLCDSVFGEGQRGNGERGNGSENFSALLSTFLTISNKKPYSKNL